jgi:hypothetical protein
MLVGSLVMLTADVAAQPGDLCGRPMEKAAALFERLSKSEKLPEIHRDKAYVALFDKARETTWTFTVAGHPAHPSAVCRHLVKDGDRLRIDMNIACSAPEAECEKLADAFEELNQQMLKELDKQKK